MKIRLEDPDPAWAARFRDLRARLAGELRETALAIEHVGSTAVPGLCAKPVVDVLLVVPDATDEAAYFGPVERCGFEFRLREPDWHEHRLVGGAGVRGGEDRAGGGPARCRRVEPPLSRGCEPPGREPPARAGERRASSAVWRAGV